LHKFNKHFKIVIQRQLAVLLMNNVENYGQYLITFRQKSVAYFFDSCHVVQYIQVLCCSLVAYVLFIFSLC